MNRDQAACQLAAVDLSEADSCDFIAKPKEGMCMLPFPNDYYTVDDPSSPTGKRINFSNERHAEERSEHADRPDQVRSDSDGFSHGQGIVVRDPRPRLARGSCGQ